MGFKVTIEANEKIDLGLETVKNVYFDTDTPDDSNARSTDLGMELTIMGKIRADVGGVEDTTVKLPTWALVPAEEATCYAKVTVEVINTGLIVRKITMQNAFVVSYKESFDDEMGVGNFYLRLRQKKDLNNKVTCEGGFSA